MRGDEATEPDLGRAMRVEDVIIMIRKKDVATELSRHFFHLPDGVTKTIMWDMNPPVQL